MSLKYGPSSEPLHISGRSNPGGAFTFEVNPTGKVFKLAAKNGMLKWYMYHVNLIDEDEARVWGDTGVPRS